MVGMECEIIWRGVLAVCLQSLTCVVEYTRNDGYQVFYDRGIGGRGDVFWKIVDMPQALATGLFEKGWG